MSPPDTNLEKQKRRHWGPLWGMALVGVFVTVILVWYVVGIGGNSTQPTGPDVQVDGSTGETENVDEPVEQTLPE